mmetsp:Transcript_53531/g.116979  ORF Transcript_53531/g.116979 Transcript_53531/m.116979 type:complete len:326 (+) Transcript_53531:224-1201(+)
MAVDAATAATDSGPAPCSDRRTPGHDCPSATEYPLQARSGWKEDFHWTESQSCGLGLGLRELLLHLQGWHKVACLAAEFSERGGGEEAGHSLLPFQCRRHSPALGLLQPHVSTVERGDFGHGVPWLRSIRRCGDLGRIHGGRCILCLPMAGQLCCCGLLSSGSGADLRLRALLGGLRHSAPCVMAAGRGRLRQVSADGDGDVVDIVDVVEAAAACRHCTGELPQLHRRCGHTHAALPEVGSPQSPHLAPALGRVAQQRLAGLDWPSAVEGRKELAGLLAISRSGQGGASFVYGGLAKSWAKTSQFGGLFPQFPKGRSHGHLPFGG